jgi:hypothetical protein
MSLIPILIHAYITPADDCDYTEMIEGYETLRYYNPHLHIVKYNSKFEIVYSSCGSLPDYISNIGTLLPMISKQESEDICFVATFTLEGMSYSYSHNLPDEVRDYLSGHTRDGETELFSYEGYNYLLPQQ